MNARRGKKRVLGANTGPKPRKVPFRDLSIYGRVLRLPSQPGFAPLRKADVSRDFRGIAQLPLLPEDDAENDDLLAEASRRLPPELAARVAGAAGVMPDPAPSRGDERPQMIAALETAAFDDMDDEDDDPATVFEPSRAMSGWVAARVLAESTTRTLLMSGAPGMLTSASGATIAASSGTHMAPLGSAFTSAVTALAGAVQDGVNAAGFTVRGGSSHATGLPVGLGPLRLELSLMERLAALSARREESDKRFMSLRRTYVNQLRAYAMEMKENSSAMDALRGETVAAREAVRPGRPGAFATDEEEVHAIHRLLASSHAILRQNLQLRERLAAATGRAAGVGVDAAEADYFAVELSGVAPLGRGVSLHSAEHGGAQTVVATPLRKRDDVPHATRRGSDAMDEDAPAPPGPQADEDAYAATIRKRSGPRRTATAAVSSAKDTLFAAGDLVSTQYGRGAVVHQRDSDAMLAVRLRWGATVYMPSAQAALLAIAGEEFCAPERNDGSYHVSPFTPAGTPEAPSATLTADELLFSGGGAATAAGRAKAARGKSRARAAASASETTAVRRMDAVSVVDGLHRGGSSAAAAREREEDAAAATRATKKLKTASGHSFPTRSCVFRTSWAQYGAPRGVALRIDGARGNQTGGFFVGTVDGFADSSHVFVTAQVSAAERASSRMRLDSAGDASGSMLRTGSYSGGLDAQNVSPFGNLSGRYDSVSLHATYSSGEPASASASVAANLNATASARVQFAAAPPMHASMGALALHTGGHHALPDAMASPLHAHAGASTATALQRYRAEVQRLIYQLRMSEESRREQRQRLTESRHTMSRLLEQLNEARAQLSVIGREMGMRDAEILNLSTRLGRMYERFAPETEKLSWAAMQAMVAAERGMAAARAAAAAPAHAPMDAADGGDDDDVDDEPPPPARAGVKRPRGGGRGGRGGRRGGRTIMQSAPREEDMEEEDADDMDAGGNGAEAEEEETPQEEEAVDDAEDATAAAATLGSWLAPSAPASRGDAAGGPDDMDDRAAASMMAALTGGNSSAPPPQEDDAPRRGRGRGRGGARRGRGAALAAAREAKAAAAAVASGTWVDAPSAVDAPVAGVKRVRRAYADMEDAGEAESAPVSASQLSRQSSGIRGSGRMTSPLGHTAQMKGEDAVDTFTAAEVDAVLAVEEDPLADTELSMATQKRYAAVRDAYAALGSENPRRVRLTGAAARAMDLQYPSTAEKVTVWPQRAGARLGGSPLVGRVQEFVRDRRDMWSRW